jgi:hypothetical protein
LVQAAHMHAHKYTAHVGNIAVLCITAHGGTACCGGCRVCRGAHPPPRPPHRLPRCRPCAARGCGRPPRLGCGSAPCAFVRQFTSVRAQTSSPTHSSTRGVTRGHTSVRPWGLPMALWRGSASLRQSTAPTPAAFAASCAWHSRHTHSDPRCRCFDGQCTSFAACDSFRLGL